MERTKTRFKVRRRKIIILISLIFFIIFTFFIFIFYYATHGDSKRNENVNEGNSNISLIEKNLVEGFKDTKTTGIYSFRLPDKDINQMLLSINKDSLWKNAESVYYENKDEHHFYVDLKPRLFLKTRVDVLLFDEGQIENTYTKSIKIIYKKMGKLQYLPSRLNYAEFSNEISNKTLLPVTYNSDSFVISPVTLLDYFPNQKVLSYLKELINIKPECLTLDNNSLFGFDINLSLFRDNSLIKEISYDKEMLDSKVQSSLSSAFLSSISEGESKAACSLSISNINGLISSKLDLNPQERLISSLSNRMVLVGINDVFITLKDQTHLSFITVISFNGYEIYVENVSQIETYESDLEITFMLNDKYLFKNKELSGGENQILNSIKNSLLSTLIHLDSEYNFFSYEQQNNSFTIDLRNVGDSVPYFFMYEGTIAPNLAIPSGFDVIISK